jgi:hypothetical protein
VARIDDLLLAALKSAGDKPSDSAKAPTKKAYSEKISNVVALAIADEMRARGLSGARPAPPGEFDTSGAERRMAGGIGAKKVDVTWATEEAGLLLGISIKTINFHDKRTGNFQKNLTNRRGDMLFEAVTLHRRFPYAVLGGLFFLDRGAAADATDRRRSTFLNAHSRLRLFTGRDDPGGRDEQYERLYIVLVEASSSHARFDASLVGEPGTPVPMSRALDELLMVTAIRNPDFYEFSDGNLVSPSG